uniref:Uncharacterized protein n=1 Tax=Panagrolaimus davidi TaxID=227884 RepID=A0A914QLU6_9BILA
MNSFSTLESVSSTTTFEKSNYGVREIANKFDNDNTLEDVTSLASTNESSENDDFSETPIIRTPYPN